ncbi:MAG: hypothetical protein GXY74_10590 [Phycisphaerae bacterium]|nr:hypothetical protein [Phycisphaerae bacterium]
MKATGKSEGRRLVWSIAAAVVVAGAGAVWAYGQEAAQPAEETKALAASDAGTEPSADPKPAGEAAAADADGDLITVKFQDVELSSVLKLWAEQRQLNLMAGKDVQGKVTAELYGVTLDEALHAVLDVNGYAFRRDGKFIFIYTKQQLEELKVKEAKTDTRVFHLNFINVDDARQIIQPALSEKAKVAGTSRAAEGIPSGGTAVGGDSLSAQDVLVVTDYVDNLKQVEHILGLLDVRPKQVLVEATILEVTLQDDCSLGIDFNVLAGIDFRGLTPATGYDVLNPNSTVMNAGLAAGTVDIPYGRTGTTGFATPGTGFQVGVMTSEVSVFVQALETVSDVNILSNPKVLALNKQRAEVIVGRRLGYRTTTVTQTTAVETVEFLDTGTQLQFRPFVSNDGFVRMEIHPEVSNGSIDGLGLPSETTTEVTCNVMVRDGHTIVIGGLFDENTQIDKSQVPGLGNLPLVGALFRQDHQATTRREIIVLLTPHIVDHGEAEAEGRELLDVVEQTMSGLRSRFPLYTREKLTQLHVSEAEKFYNKYLETNSVQDRGLALWNLKLARHVAPNNRQVRELIDKLETEQGVARPRLQSESVLWRRLNQSGMLDGLPPVPARSGEAAESPQPNEIAKPQD